MIRLMGAIILAVICGNCRNNSSTQDFLDADFISKGQSAISLLAPVENAQIATHTPTFVWTSGGANLYTIEIAKDAAFSHNVLQKDVTGTNYTLRSSDLAGGAALTTGTHYWRVKIAHVANNLQSMTGSFMIFAIPASGSGYGGIIYVDSDSAANGEQADVMHHSERFNGQSRRLRPRAMA